MATVRTWQTTAHFLQQCWMPHVDWIRATAVQERDAFPGGRAFVQIPTRSGTIKPKLDSKREPHKKPELKNQDKLKFKELDDQIAKFDDGFGNEFYVELWAYKLDFRHVSGVGARLK